MNLVLNLWNLEDGSGDCMCFIKSKLPKFLSICMNYFPQNHVLTALITENVEAYFCETGLFKYSFFPDVIVQCNKLDINLRNGHSKKCST